MTNAPVRTLDWQSLSLTAPDRVLIEASAGTGKTWTIAALYLRLLRDEGSVAQRLAGLLGGSRLVADLLPRAPDVLKLLVEDKDLLAPEPETVAGALMARSKRAGATGCT